MSMQIDQGGIYTDLAGLQKLKSMPDENSDEALAAVAKQFESIFVNMMLKSMRDTNAVFEEDNFMHSNESKFYQDMMDNQMAVSLSQGNGIGLADVLYRQLKAKVVGPEDIAAAEAAMNGGAKPTGELNFLDRLHQPRMPTSKAKPADEPFASPQAFAEKIFPLAEQAAAKVNVDPRFLVSQAALETGWGQNMIKHTSGDNSFNLFGIKADSRWQGDVVTVPTVEYRDGLARREQADFRAYDSYEASVQDYVSFIQNNGRYQQALNNTDTGEAYVNELQRAGYATDPRYAEKIKAIADQPMLMALAGEE